MADEPMADEPMYDEPMYDEPMYDEPMYDEPMYDEWIANRRAVEPSRELTDRVMAAVDARDGQRKHFVRLADRMNESRPARWAACLAALLVGSLPFLFVAYATELLVF